MLLFFRNYREQGPCFVETTSTEGQYKVVANLSKVVETRLIAADCKRTDCCVVQRQISPHFVGAYKLREGYSKAEWAKKYTIFDAYRIYVKEADLPDTLTLHKDWAYWYKTHIHVAGEIEEVGEKPTLRNLSEPGWALTKIERLYSTFHYCTWALQQFMHHAEEWQDKWQIVLKLFAVEYKW